MGFSRQEYWSGVSLPSLEKQDSRPQMEPHAKPRIPIQDNHYSLALPEIESQTSPPGIALSVLVNLPDRPLP